MAEALTNAARHAEATSVRIAAFCMDDWLHVEVSDDGNGGADMDGGTGLQGLQDRVEAIGGQMLVSSPLGEGTTLRARLPCE